MRYLLSAAGASLYLETALENLVLLEERRRGLFVDVDLRLVVLLREERLLLVLVREDLVDGRVLAVHEGVAQQHLLRVDDLLLLVEVARSVEPELAPVARLRAAPLPRELVLETRQLVEEARPDLEVRPPRVQVLQRLVEAPPEPIAESGSGVSTRCTVRARDAQSEHETHTPSTRCTVRARDA